MNCTFIRQYVKIGNAILPMTFNLICSLILLIVFISNDGHFNWGPGTNIRGLNAMKRLAIEASLYVTL